MAKHHLGDHAQAFDRLAQAGIKVDSIDVFAGDAKDDLVARMAYGEVQALIENEVRES